MRFLSQSIGLPVRDPSGEPIGVIADLIVAIGNRYPPVTRFGDEQGLVVADGESLTVQPIGTPGLLLVRNLGFEAPGFSTGHPSDFTTHLAVYQDGRQIADKVIRVNDVSLDEVGRGLRVVAVDVGAAGLLRRMGVEGPARSVARGLGRAVPERYIDWEDVDPLEGTIASVRLRVPHARLAQLHPADLAPIIEELTPRDRLGVLGVLNDEAFADVVEEMEPDTQVEVLEDLEPARAADILEEMSPDDAADLVADLSDRSRDEILALMEADEAAEVRDLLAFPEDSAGGLMTTELVAMSEGMSAAQAIERLRELEPDAETIYYVYVVDGDERLVGVLSLRDLIVARPDTAIAEVMIDQPVAVGVLEPAESVAETIAHYNLLAIPVVDDQGRLAGIVTVDDAIDTVAPSAWRRRLPRVFSRATHEPGSAGEPTAAAGRGRDGAPRR